MGNTKTGMEKKMEYSLEVWLSNPLLSLEEVAEKAGISRTQFWRYRQMPEYMAEYRKRCRARFEALEAKALEVLEIKLNEEDWKATQYVLDGLDYNGKTKVEASTATTITINVGEEDNNAESAE